MAFRPALQEFSMISNEVNRILESLQCCLTQSQAAGEDSYGPPTRSTAFDPQCDLGSV
jgi:hypothetical protein